MVPFYEQNLSKPILQRHNGVCEETFDVNCKIAQLKRNLLNFIVRKSNLQEMANFGDYPGDFQTLIWRPVQNLESPGLSGRVDSPVIKLHQGRGLLFRVRSIGTSGFRF